MNSRDPQIFYLGNSVKISTDFGEVCLDFGRAPTVEDTQAIHKLMNLGARIYADKIRQAQLKVDDLVNWRGECNVWC